MTKERPCHCCGGTGVENDHIAIGTRLKLKRQHADILAKEVAEKIGVSAQFLSDLEKGRRTWTEKLIADYERALR